MADIRKAVVALGHEALGVTTLKQWEAVRSTAEALADLTEQGLTLTITHSNGPQVSMIHKAMTELHRLNSDYTPAPMSVCSAMSQGYVGYDLQSALKSALLARGDATPVGTILTQVTVDPYDEAFYTPTKTIGRFMSREDADAEIKKGNFVREIPGSGYLRTVAAPHPIRIVELDIIRTLTDNGVHTIACGGGGIPVIEQNHRLKGASAVIEKDEIAGRLAIDLAVEQLIILTSVPCVYSGFHTDEPTPILRMNVAQAQECIRAGEFGETGMLPKIEAAIAYLTACPKGRVLITSIGSVGEALKGRAGTAITAE
ncbi:MAG: carbamate kinase [Lachnospiraceae bacterium]|nr:carbamate kinase [Lachnospiraceae bacterium]